MNDRPPVHIEHLFATPLIVDMAVDINRLPLLDAIRGAVDHRSRSTMIWDDGAESKCLEAAAPLIAYMRRIVDRSSVDIRTGTCPSWRVQAVVHVVEEGAQPEFPPCYTAYWTALYVLADGYSEITKPGSGGELVLLDPRLPSTMIEAPDLRLLLGRNPTSHYAPEVLVRPANGQLLLYPSWLRVQQRSRPTGAKRLLVEARMVPPLD